MTPELELILACARRQPAEQTPAVRALLARSALDWGRLVGLGTAHGLASTLERAVAAADSDRVPEAAQQQLREHSLAAEWRQQMLTDELLRLCQAFEQERTPLLCFKGPALAHLAWEDPRLRGCADLDLLVPRDLAPAAARLLEARGYQRIFPARPLRPRFERAYLETWNEYVFVSGDDLVEIDLHWSTSPRRYPFRFELDEAWASPLAVTVGDRSVPTLPVEALLLALSIHGTKHLWARLVWICDIDRLLRAFPGLDWDAVLALARRARGERSLLLGLAVSGALLGTPLPHEVARRVAGDASVAALAARVPGFLEFADLPRSFLREALGIRPQLLPALDSRGDAARYVWRTLTTAAAPDWMRIPLPGPLYPAYTVLRPLRLAARAARLGWQALTAERSDSGQRGAH